jgi:hypothetical protein
VKDLEQIFEMYATVQEINDIVIRNVNVVSIVVSTIADEFDYSYNSAMRKYGAVLIKREKILRLL